MKPICLPGKELLIRRLFYCPVTGIFKWKERFGFIYLDEKRAPVAGTVKSNGYLQIRVDSRIYLAHRLAWKIIHGADPVLEIDHIDHNRLNNAISNLRELTHQENCARRLG